MSKKESIPTMESDILKLLSFLCVEWGFCISPCDKNAIAKSEFIDADKFACSILKAENMDVEVEVEWRRKIRKLFAEKFGSNLSLSDY